MIKLARNGYTDAEIKSALHGARGTRSVSFRYELLDKNNNFKSTLYNVLSASIDYGVFNDIRRTAKFNIQDLEAVPIDYYSDRIRPYMILDMPMQDRQKTDRIRYIRDWTNGSTFNAHNHWCEIQAYTKDGTNVALSKPVVGSAPFFSANYDGTKVTDGIIAITGNYAEIRTTGQPECVTIDLGAPMEVETIKVWHYYSGTRYYHGTKTEVSMDGVDWITLRDSAVSGEYLETAEGLELSVKRPKSVEFPLGIFMLASPERVDGDEGITRSIDAYDLSLILKDDKVDDLYTITAGTNYKAAMVAVLQSAGITQYSIEDTTSTLTRDLQFEPGTSKYEILNTLTTNLNYIPIIVDVNGTFTSYTYQLPDARAVDYVYEDNDISVIMKGVSEELDTFGIPNKWIVVRTNSEEEPLRSVYTNENPDSPTSTVNRGRVIVDYRELEDIASQASLDAHTKRIAENASQIYGKSKFSTALMPMHDYHDIIHLKYKELGIDAKFTETAWTMELSAGGAMSHEIRRVVKL